jgi:hypothetical protein
MWYHYVVGLIAFYFVVKTVYDQVTVTYTSWYSRIASLVGLVVSYFALSWSYNGIYPPTMFGGRRY